MFYYKILGIYINYEFHLSVVKTCDIEIKPEALF